MKQVPAQLRCDWDVADSGALQALYRGDASPEQQRRALVWIIDTAAMTYDMSYVPGDTHATAFIEGRRFVGTQVRKLLQVINEAFTNQGNPHA